MDDRQAAEYHPLLRFGDFVLCPHRRCLCRGQKPIHLRGKVFKTLLCLVENGGNIVTRERLLHAVWADVSVVPNVIDHTIAEIRHALDDHGTNPKFLETVVGQGFRFIAKIEQLPEGPLPCESKGSLAILPFLTLGLMPDEEWLGKGLADALITRISSVQDILICPSGAVMKYSALATSPLEAGRDLRVTKILEGTIQRSAERFRVTLQLLSVSDGKPLWAGTYDEKVKDVFSLEDSICEKVIQTLLPKLLNRPRVDS